MTDRISTLRLRMPLGRTLGHAVLLLGLLVGLAEMTARTDFVRSHLPAPSIGSGHNYLDVKLAQLQTLVEEEGPVDCIFLGNSAIHRSIRPDVFAEAFQASTGRAIRCFNFGAAGLILPNARLFAKILADTYQPRLMVLGLVLVSGGRQHEYLQVHPWVQHRNGMTSLKGWLIEHSYVYRYYLRFRIWLEQPAYSRRIQRSEHLMSRFGYVANNRMMNDSDTSPDLQHMPEIWRKIKLPLAFLSAFEDILRLNQPLMNLVVVEMPSHPSVSIFLAPKADEYNRNLREARRLSRLWEVPHWTTQKLPRIPDEGWQDRRHLNDTGAEIYSEWLGRELGQAVNQDRLPRNLGRPEAEER